MNVSVRKFLLGIAVWGLLPIAAWAGEFDREVSFDIAPQSLASAVLNFAEQSKIQVVTSSGELERFKTQGLKGNYSVRSGLSALLSGTGLTFQEVGGGTVSIGKSNLDSMNAAGAGAGGIQLAQVEVAPPSPASGEGAPKGADEDRSKVQEIVVTAQKRQENLQDTPISIAVLSGQKLDASTSRGLADELNLIPGVAITKAGQAEGVQVVIRGVATNALFSGASNVSYSVDGAPFGMIVQGIAPDLTPFDLERVEVLRGPQGTLYGASAMAGAVNILTRDPDLNEFDLKMQTLLSSTKGGGLNYGGDAAVNIPIIPERLAMRAVVSEHEDAGWIDAPLYGAKDRNDGTRSSYRFKIGAQPTDELTLDLSAWLTRNHSGAPGLSRSNQQQEAAAFEEPIDVEYDNYVAKAGYDFQSFSVTSTTSYLDYELESVLDLAGTAIPAFAGILLQTNFYSEVFAQEVNFASTTEGPWSWTAGLFYRDAKEKLVSIFPSISDNDFNYTSESYATFGELTRSFLDDRLRMTVGLRYFDDHVTFEETKPFNFDTSRPLITNDGDFNKLTGRAVLAWLPNDDLTFYASYGQGYRSGIVQGAYEILVSGGTLPPADPDLLINYEIGAKGALFDGRLNFETAIYYMDWKNYRSSFLINFNNFVLTQVGNFGSAGGFGAEGAINVELFDGFKVGASLSWNDLTLDSSGSRPDDSPELTAGGTIDYSFPLGGRGIEGIFSAAVNYQSKKKAFFGGVTGTTFTDPYLFTRASFTLNWPDHWSLSAFVDNITDEYRVVQLNRYSRPDWDSRQRPRTFGVQLNYRY